MTHLLVKDVENAISKDFVAFLGHVVRIGNISRQFAAILQTGDETSRMLGRRVIGHEVRSPRDVGFWVEYHLTEIERVNIILNQ